MSTVIYSLKFHHLVAVDYATAYEWYEAQQQGLGDRFRKQVTAKLKMVLALPFAYGVKANTGFREAQIKGFPYLIIFRVYPRKKVVFVNKLHHTAMDPKKKYRRPTI